MLSKKNIILGKVNIIICIIFFSQLFFFKTFSQEDLLNEEYAELNILDKVSSKTSSVNIKVGDEFIFQNLQINVLKCQNSKFDDDPEVTAYMQVKDLKSANKNNNHNNNDALVA